MNSQQSSKIEKFGEERVNIIGIYVDKSFIGKSSKHGNLIEEIKCEIRKEVGDIFAQKVEESAIDNWNLTELVRVKEQIRNLIERFNSFEKYQDKTFTIDFRTVDFYPQAELFLEFIIMWIW